MKRLVYILIFILSFSKLSAQQQADTVPPLELQRQVFVYSLATKYNDNEMAKSALYNILSITPRNVGILDSLALMYFQNGQYASAALVSQDVININPDDMMATEIAAISFETIGVKEKAITYYEKLYLNNDDLGVLYQASFLQYEEQRFSEAKVNLDIIIESPQADNEFLTVQGANRATMQIPMKAGAYRLKGMILLEQGDNEGAKEQYRKGLELAPQFAALKKQLEDLN